MLPRCLPNTRHPKCSFRLAYSLTGHKQSCAYIIQLFVQSVCEADSTLNMGNYGFFIILVLTGFALSDAQLNQSLLDAIFLRFYKRNGSYEDANLRDAHRLVPQLNPNEMLLLYQHGHVETLETPSVLLMTGTFLNYTNANVMALEYSIVSNTLYVLSVQQTEEVGKLVAKTLDRMVEAGWNHRNIHIIGHSLGAQLAGYIGRNTNFRIPRITGLDPAGPLYYIDNPYLSSSDAEYVDIIHTDTGVYGLAITSGTADFFPNFGHKIQPGCPLFRELITNRGLCSHQRSFKFYAESVRNRNAFIGVKCPNGILYSLGLCNSNEKVIMGYYSSPFTKGSFYLHTNSEEPYGLGLEGATYSGVALRKRISDYVRSVTS